MKVGLRSGEERSLRFCPQEWPVVVADLQVTSIERFRIDDLIGLDRTIVCREHGRRVIVLEACSAFLEWH